MRVCYEVNMLNPSHIDMDIPTKDQLTSLVDGKELAAKRKIQDSNYHIDNYQLKSPKKTGMDLFNQTIQFRKNHKNPMESLAVTLMLG